MQDEATIEARRLATNLHSIDTDIAESAYAVWLALGSVPDQETLMGCAATLEIIRQRLPRILFGAASTKENQISYRGLSPY